jgi:cytochrome c
MKKVSHLSAILLMTLLIASCGGKKANNEEYVANEAPKTTEAPVDVIAQGEALVKGNDCKICHSEDKKIIGPSHADVAKKYEFTEANVKLLAGKIINGGTGVWGEVPMSPHLNLSQDDAEKMAKYVLSLDGEKLH